MWLLGCSRLCTVPYVKSPLKVFVIFSLSLRFSYFVVCQGKMSLLFRQVIALQWFKSFLHLLFVFLICKFNCEMTPKWTDLPDLSQNIICKDTNPVYYAILYIWIQHPFLFKKIQIFYRGVFDVTFYNSGIRFCPEPLFIHSMHSCSFTSICPERGH